jgi:hypothetical protein
MLELNTWAFVRFRGEADMDRGAMPITPFLDGLQFEPETKRVMDVAFEMARVILEQQWGDHADTILAGRIVALAKAGDKWSRWRFKAASVGGLWRGTSLVRINEARCRRSG